MIQADMMLQSALFAEWDEISKCSRTLTLKNQCIPGLSAERKELRENMIQCETVNAAAMCIWEVCWKNALRLPING